MNVMILSNHMGTRRDRFAMTVIDGLMLRVTLTRAFSFASPIAAEIPPRRTD